MANARELPWGRIILAGPWTLLASFIVMASLATWLPPGAAQVDNLIVPLVLYPAIWAVLFFHAILRKKLVRATIENIALTCVCSILLVYHFLTI